MPSDWELYNVEKDPAETNEPGRARARAKLIEMIALWYVEAGKYKVLPLDSRGTMRFADERPQIDARPHEVHLLSATPQLVPGERRRLKVLEPPAQHHRRSSRFPRAGAEGVLRRHGLRQSSAATALFIKDKKLHYVAQLRRRRRSSTSNRPSAVPEGKVELRFEFEPTGKPDIEQGKGAPGRAQLYINGKLSASRPPVHDAARVGLGGGFCSAAIRARPYRRSTRHRSSSPVRSNASSQRPAAK